MWFWRSNAPTPVPDDAIVEESTEEVNLDDAYDTLPIETTSEEVTTSTTKPKINRQPFVPKEGLQFTHKKELNHEEGKCSDEHLLENLLTEQEREALALMKSKDQELTSEFSDRMLVRFILAKKLDVDEALETLKCYKEWQKMLKLHEFDKKESLDLLRYTLSEWLPGRYDKKGRAAIWVRAKNLSPEILGSMIKYLRSCHYLLDITLDHDIDIQRKGFIICEDLNGHSFSKMLALLKYRSKDVDSPDMLTCITRVQKSLPIRLRGFYLVDAPWYCKILVPIVKPFLQPKLANKINLVTREQLKEVFEEDMIPPDYGGTFDGDWLTLLDEVEAQRDDKIGEGRYLSPSVRS